MDNQIYILHENGSNPHYRALDYLCSTKGTKLEYYEFSIGKSLVKSLLRRDLQLFKKQFLNIIFLMNLLFSRNKRVVLGIAPYDFRLIFLSLILRNHKVYYHTSWTCWNKSYYSKKLFVSKFLIQFWGEFLKKDIIRVFSVTVQTKDKLISKLFSIF